MCWRGLLRLTCSLLVASRRDSPCDGRSRWVRWGRRQGPARCVHAAWCTALSSVSQTYILLESSPHIYNGRRLNLFEVNNHACFCHCLWIITRFLVMKCLLRIRWFLSNRWHNFHLVLCPFRWPYRPKGFKSFTKRTIICSVTYILCCFFLLNTVLQMTLLSFPNSLPSKLLTHRKTRKCVQ